VDIRNGHIQELDCGPHHWRAFLVRFSLDIQLGRRSICTMADRLLVRTSSIILDDSKLTFPIRVLFQLTMVVVYPLFIQPLFNTLSSLPDGELRSRINILAAKLNFPLTHLYEIDSSKRSSHSNAYFYGLPWVSYYSSRVLQPLIIEVCRVSTSSYSTPLSSRLRRRKWRQY